MRPCIFVVGTRAQLVKIAPVLRTAASSDLPHTVWLAGQHRESVADLIKDFRLESEIVAPSLQKERSSVGGLLQWLPSALRNCYSYVRRNSRQNGSRPLVVVHGDTLSTLVGAVAGKLAGADVVHLESGLSSKRLSDPFPEEILRRLTFRLTRYALCPNPEAGDRMRRFGRCEVVETGDNTLLDCVRYALKDADAIDAGRQDYFVASVHRFGNIYRKADLTGILEDILDVAKLGVVHFVLHPITERRLRKLDLLDMLSSEPKIELRARMPFTEFMTLLAGARAVFSDGGSNQEELSYLGIPTILFRERSERPDGLGANVVFRKDIDGSLAQFIGAGKLDQLRQPSRIDMNVQPSRIAVEALMRWAQDAAA
jgi:UDP-N-acetylglucosamine 2-epimerase (non-hydrolysing)